MKVNWKKFGLRLVQGALSLLTMVGVAGILVTMYRTDSDSTALFVIFIGSLAATYMVVLIAAINNRINRDKEEA